ncbi:MULTISPECIES: hypothetical protein [Fischerella]|uniref:Uncharacterized protein n=1 Tax=Fischerella muscicola CCMEE 5323 TaxID=2019572 RepID=A0A2N6JZS0_FISMU|nr:MULTISPECIES: hypothetical protein [Fischerella]MBD2429634.1 hypothetical protein [Fischerella sp. FACHB-380]PLZ86967.1 hypothetical protein CEN44_18705 [Fischerella muscicola CCMEE 5323]
MGRWTPLILMAGGLAILLGTLLGISFPMGGQNTAQAPGGKTSKVLPANINVNSTAAGTNNTSTNRTNVAQNNAADDTMTDTTTTAQDTGTTDDTQSNDTNQDNEPIRALW